MTATDAFLIILSVMCVYLGAMIQKIATVMANDPDVADDLQFIRQFIPKRKKRGK